jgi:hypothetical protein
LKPLLPAARLHPAALADVDYGQVPGLSNEVRAKLIARACFHSARLSADGLGDTDFPFEIVPPKL